jgi:CarD family transcriptional regulator
VKTLSAKTPAASIPAKAAAAKAAAPKAAVGKAPAKSATPAKPASSAAAVKAPAKVSPPPAPKGVPDAKGATPKAAAKVETAIEKPVATKAAPAVAPAKAQVAAQNAAQVSAPLAKTVEAKVEVKIDVKVETKPAAPKASGAHRTGFKSQEFIVYPAHGVGQIVAIEEQEVAGFKLELFVISFAKDKMTLKVPLPKVLAGAIRKLSDADVVKRSLDTLTGRARVKRTMWSRRAQEYEAKINSGDLISIAEVVRDLYRSEAQPEQSYSERQLYEAALDRMARELAAVQKLTDSESLKLVEQHLERGPKRGARADVIVEADAEGDAEPEGDNIEAAA